MSSLSSQKWPPIKKSTIYSVKWERLLAGLLPSVQRRHLNSSSVQVPERAVIVPLEKWPPIFKKINNLHVLANSVKWESILDYYFYSTTTFKFFLCTGTGTRCGCPSSPPPQAGAASPPCWGWPACSSTPPPHPPGASPYWPPRWVMPKGVGPSTT